MTLNISYNMPPQLYNKSHHTVHGAVRHWCVYASLHSCTVPSATPRSIFLSLSLYIYMYIQKYPSLAVSLSLHLSIFFGTDKGPFVRAAPTRFCELEDLMFGVTRRMETDAITVSPNTNRLCLYPQPA